MQQYFIKQLFFRNKTLNNQQAKGYELAIQSAFESRLMDQLAAAIKQEDDVLYVVTMKATNHSLTLIYVF